ncbi:MAG TPA: hypothetical protein VEZ90_19220 [Blastocatellia bacterium]|nr:hypothetical protein [Blastocatellia bacterium]
MNCYSTNPSAITTRFRYAAVLVLVLYILTLCKAQSPSSPPASDREERWRQDLKFFAAEFPTRHIDFAKLYPQAKFDGEIEALQTDIAKLPDTEIVLRLMRLVASANVGHTMVYLPGGRSGFRSIPFSFKWYSDGLAVVGAAPDYASALGARVLRIGSLTPEQVLTAIAPYISHENDAWLREQSSSFIRSLPILKRIGAVRDDGRVELTLAKPGGEPFTLVAGPGGGPAGQTSLFGAVSSPAPLYRKHLDSYYWYEYLADSRALYIQYNRCSPDPKLPFKDFASGLFAFADSHPVERVIVDLRFNSGGNSLIVWPFITGLKERKRLASHVYVLIGPTTFSSAQDNAIELRDTFHAMLVGEATGERPNGYGEVRAFKLPNSGLTVQYCTRYFLLVKESDPSALEPDVRTPTALVDVLAGRDPVLEAALKQSLPISH